MRTQIPIRIEGNHVEIAVLVPGQADRPGFPIADVVQWRQLAPVERAHRPDLLLDVNIHEPLTPFTTVEVCVGDDSPPPLTRTEMEKLFKEVLGRGLAPSAALASAVGGDDDTRNIFASLMSQLTLENIDSFSPAQLTRVEAVVEMLKAAIAGDAAHE